MQVNSDQCVSRIAPRGLLGALKSQRITKYRLLFQRGMAQELASSCCSRLLTLLERSVICDDVPLRDILAYYIAICSIMPRFPRNRLPSALTDCQSSTPVPSTLCSQVTQAKWPLAAWRQSLDQVSRRSWSAIPPSGLSRCAALSAAITARSAT